MTDISHHVMGSLHMVENTTVEVALGLGEKKEVALETDYPFMLSHACVRKITSHLNFNHGFSLTRLQFHRS